MPVPGIGNAGSTWSYDPYREIDVRSQWMPVTSIPNAAIAAAPIGPVIVFVCGAIASNARAMRSSLSQAGGTPYTSSTAQSRAHCSTPTIDDGLASRLAINTSITSPCVNCAGLGPDMPRR